MAHNNQQPSTSGRGPAAGSQNVPNISDIMQVNGEVYYLLDNDADDYGYYYRERPERKPKDPLAKLTKTLTKIRIDDDKTNQSQEENQKVKASEGGSGMKHQSQGDSEMES